MSGLHGPAVLELHVGRSCQLNCVFCYRQGAPYCEAHPPLQEDRYVALLREFAELGGREVYLSGGLEPFSCPLATLQALVAASHLGLRTRVYSNGVASALATDYVRTMIAAYADWLRFSIHAITEETFRAVERPSVRTLTLRRTIANVEAIAALRQPAEGWKVGVSFLVLPQNARELLRAAGFWQNRVDFFDVRADVRLGGDPCEAVRRAVTSLRTAALAGRFLPLQINIGDFLQGKPSFAPLCYVPQEKLVVDPFGLAWACCTMAHPGMRPPWARIGDLAEESLGQVVTRLRQRLPLRHCRTCCPGDAAFNRSAHQAYQRSRGCPGMAAATK